MVWLFSIPNNTSCYNDGIWNVRFILELSCREKYVLHLLSFKINGNSLKQLKPQRADTLYKKDGCCQILVSLDF